VYQVEVSSGFYEVSVRGIRVSGYLSDEVSITIRGIARHQGIDSRYQVIGFVRDIGSRYRVSVRGINSSIPSPLCEFNNGIDIEASIVMLTSRFYRVTASFHLLALG